MNALSVRTMALVEGEIAAANSLAIARTRSTVGASARLLPANRGRISDKFPARLRAIRSAALWVHV